MSDATSARGDELTARAGELRRLTILYSDIVGSTELSGRWEPEAYRELISRYRSVCREVIESDFEGHIVQIKGDGILAVFGFPVAHENDTERAVRAGLELVRAVQNVSVRDTTGEELEIRVAVHHGPLYIDLDEDDVYGLAANVGARLQAIAEPGTVVISPEVRELVDGRFAIEPGDPQVVKGVQDPLRPYRVIGERRVPVPRPWATPLIERNAELDRLRQAWARASSGTAEHRGGLLVSGEAGVGKSRLLAAFVDEAAAAGTPVLELHGSPFHTDVGFHPIRSLIEGRCGIANEVDPAMRLKHLAAEVGSLGLDTAGALPLLAPLLGIAPAAGYEPVAVEGHLLQEQIAAAARSYIRACAAGQPTVIAAEDLHWFDDATRSLLTTLAEDEPQGALVISTSRESEDGSWEAIQLQPLTEPGRLELIDALEEGLGEQDRAMLAARSGGIPLYLEELVRAGPDYDTVADDAPPVPGSVPAALYEPLVARLYATPAALPVAAAAAAAGQEVDRSLLAATLTLPAGELDTVLGALLDARILERVANRPGRYRFRHELLRDVAYELQPPSWRRKVHSRLGDALTREGPGDWLVVASHFERAERYEESAHAYRQTAEEARLRGALQEARSQLARAIELVQPLPAEAARLDLEVDLRLRRGFLAMSLDGAGSSDAAHDYDRCLELAASDPQGDAMFSTLMSRFAYHLGRAEIERARETLTTLRSTLIGPRTVYRPINRAAFGVVEWFAGRFSSALETLTCAAAEVAEIGEEGDVSPMWFVPQDPRATMHLYVAMSRFMASDLAGADAGLRDSRGVSEPQDFPQGPWSIDYILWLASWMWTESGRLDDAQAAIDELCASSASHGFAVWQLIGATQAATLQAIVTLRSGDADSDALTAHANVLSGFIELWKALGLHAFLPFYLTTCGAVLAASDDAEGARKCYEESLDFAAQTGMRFYDAETARRLAHLASEPEAKAAALGDALELARSQGARPFELRIALDLHELLGEQARPALELAMSAFGEDVETGDLETARTRVSAPR
ncbi:MAG TPA: adenylate/guanylate cyclase domain-containing protein [Solirubrobacteraceae bacterium]|jgi:class 3 adenylate cyclase/tetratricopeptide (TPR) repeat protein